MALPTSRNTTYSASSPVLSADLNDIQDQIIAQYTRNPAEFILAIPAIMGFALSGTWTSSGGDGLAVTTTGTAVQWGIPIPIREGQTLKSVEYYYKRAGGTLNFDTYEHDLSASPFAQSKLGTGQSSSSGTSDTSILDDFSDMLVGAENQYHARFTNGTSGDILYGIRATIGNP